MKRLTLPLLTGLILLGLGTTAAVAQDWKGRGRVQGVVTDQDGNFVEGATITLTFTRGSEQGPEPLKTNKRGRWSYLGLGGGPWNVLIEHPNYAISEGTMPVSEFGSNDVLKTVLKTASAAAAGSSGADAAQAAADAAAQEAAKKLGEGQALIEQGKVEEGKAILEATIPELDAGKQSTVLHWLAGRAEAAADSDAAVAYLKRSLAASPEHKESLQLISSILVNQGKEDEAKQYVDKLGGDSGLDPNALLNQGIKKYNDNDVDGAIEAFDRVVAARDDLPDAYYYRGLAHLGKGNNDQAKADFARMLELAPDHANAAEAKQFLDYLNG